MCISSLSSQICIFSFCNWTSLAKGFGFLAKLFTIVSANLNQILFLNLLTREICMQISNWEICVQVKKRQLELDMEPQTGSKLGKEYIKAVYCHPAYLNYMQSISWEMLDWMKRKLGLRLPREKSIASDMQMSPPWWQKARTKEPLNESERGEWKSWLKPQHSEN